MTKSKDELLAEYSDSDIRDKILRLTALSEILTHCVVPYNYKVPGYLHEAVELTGYGEEKLQQFLRKRIPYAEGRLICLLEFAWIEPIIDPAKMDLHKLQEAISRQIRERDILLPFRFGRMLYDRAFETLTLSDEADSIGLPETLSLLDGTPQGVFQEGNYVTGPYGILSSKQSRYYSPSRTVPLHHCSNPSCSAIHGVTLATNREASINKHRGEAAKVLRKESEVPSAWGSFVNQLFTDVMKPARDNAADGLIPLLGDALTEAEIRLLVIWLLDNSRGELRSTFTQLGMSGRAEQMATGLDRARMMQLCFTLDDEILIQGLDILVRTQAINVPLGEIRRARVNGGSRFGTLRLTAEIGPKGARIMSSRMNLAPLRLRRLIEHMYRMDSVDDRDELDWQLRSENGETLEARLDSYLTRHSPEEVARSLILARKSNAITACTVLGLPDNSPADPELISVILWKLGFPASHPHDPNASFWRLHGEMEEMVRAGTTGPTLPSEEEFRGVAANYFVEIENMLDDSLAFTIWALTNDHFTDVKPFVYSPVDRRVASYNWLQQAVRRSRDSSLEYGEKNTLYALCRGFERLAKELKHISSERHLWERPRDDEPEWASQQELVKFPFRHLIPYLDLTDASRELIVNQLQEISRVLVSNNISDARNSWMHGGRSTAEFDEVRTSLTAIGRAVQMIEDCGFIRMNFTVTSRQIDSYDRSITRFTRARGFSFEFNRPSRYDWLGLPTLKTPIHVMPAACFSAPAHFLRFRSETRSPFSEMWMDYPRRHARSQRASRAMEDTTDAWSHLGSGSTEPEQ
ncbi:hypothetical protein WB401_15715 [Streptomyces brasiliscabiei]|uniref:Uncharacterized protein n=1 Tax=Streptomyces brasiliscabiei TaxID=2736302 RepID=A0ABU8GHB5_9ACTN